MHFRISVLASALVLLASLTASGVAPGQQAAQPRTVALSDAVLERLPAEWRPPASKLIKATPEEQQRFLTAPEEALRQTIVRLLVKSPAADAFLKSQIVKDP